MRCAVDIDDLIALADRQIDRLLGFLVQRAHEVERRFAHRQPALDHVAQFQQAHAEAVRAWLDAVDKAGDDHVVEDAVGGGGMQAGYFRQLLQTHRIGVIGQCIKQGDHAFDDLNRCFRRFDGFDFHNVVGAVQYILVTLYHNVKRIGNFRVRQHFCGPTAKGRA